MIILIFTQYTSRVRAFSLPTARNEIPKIFKRTISRRTFTRRGHHFQFSRRDLDRATTAVSMARIIFPRRNRGNDRQRTLDRSRPTYIPFITPRRARYRVHKIISRPTSARNSPRDSERVNAGSTIPPWRISAVLASSREIPKNRKKRVRTFPRIAAEFFCRNS